MADDEAGYAVVNVYLSALNDKQIEDFMEDVADLCVRYGIAASDEEEPVKSLIGAKTWEGIPEDEDELAVFLREHAIIVIPSSVEHAKKVGDPPASLPDPESPSAEEADPPDAWN